MQFTATVTADGDKRDGFHAVEAKKTPQTAQQAIDKQRSGVNQIFDRLTGIKRRRQVLLEALQTLL